MMLIRFFITIEFAKHDTIVWNRWRNPSDKWRRNLFQHLTVSVYLSNVKKTIHPVSSTGTGRRCKSKLCQFCSSHGIIQPLNDLHGREIIYNNEIIALFNVVILFYHWHGYVGLFNNFWFIISWLIVYPNKIYYYNLQRWWHYRTIRYCTFIHFFG